ncbi:MAG TPA: DUF362 domain-containing protein, partial [Candidatus Rifleibacterium sp.]|nr:DUF362 domain-containing protein [Candidatus Rifleibacterium sp.]
MDRRKFIALLSTIAASYNLKFPLALAAEEPVAAAAATTGGFPDLIGVAGGTPAAMFDRAIAAAGGIERFVKQGQKVLVKPNIGWDKKPEEGANTSPELVKRIVELCLKAGASEVRVFDNTCNHWQACYGNSGIETAVKEAGGKMLMAHEESYFTPLDVPA